MIDQRVGLRDRFSETDMISEYSQACPLRGAARYMLRGNR
jgi:hypothetical protein